MLSAPRQFVLEANEFRLLEGLKLSPRKSFAGRIRGERLTRRKGLSVEFSDYRDYAEGDDVRHMDWNVLARLESPVIRTYQDEEDLAVHILVDTSPSMDFGEPHKLALASRLACAIGYVALAGQDAVYPRALGIRERNAPVMRGRSSFVRLATWAAGLKPDGASGLVPALKEFLHSSARPGIAALLSDGLDPQLPGAIRVLGSRGHEVWLIQILSPEEIDPDLEGDLRLIDAEGGALVEITANSQAIKEYRKKLTEHCEALEAECLRVGGRYGKISSSSALKDVLNDRLKRQGWLTT